MPLLRKPNPHLLTWLGCGLVLISALGAGAQTADLFKFFAEEAQVVTASRIPQSARQAPATLYVITGEELTSSGALTLWDALRTVPGVDVMTFRTFHGTVSIRGLNRSLNSRTLVLVDGRSSMAATVDYSFWENLPVLLEDIERIEVVEGPASALYGANAVNGVINIVTKKPEQVGGGRVSYGTGERQNRTASLLYGKEQGRLGYKLGVGWRTGNSFEHPDHRASETLKGTGYLSYDLDEHTQLSLSGGRTQMQTEVGGALFRLVDTDGTMNFLRVDGAHRNTRLRCFWNNADVDLDFTAYSRTTTDHHHVFDVDLEQLIPLSARSTAVVGAGFRNTSVSSSYVSNRSSLWSAFAEHRWQPAPRWALWTSARLDAKPNTQPAFSPRFSLIFTPVPTQTLRLSAGAAYRNPSVLDNNLSFTDTVQIGNLRVRAIILGNPDLKPEQIKSVELAHQLELGRFKTTVVGFAYRLDNLITNSIAEYDVANLRDLSVQLTYLNQRQLNAWGGEAALEAPLGRRATSFVNYSYQDLTGEMDRQAAGFGTPHHKFNGGLRFHCGGFTANSSWNWVSYTLWLDNNLAGSAYQKVPGYSQATLYLGYRFTGRWQGFELRLDAFNLFDQQHYEVLRAMSPTEFGQSGEIVRSRSNLSLSYRF